MKHYSDFLKFNYGIWANAHRIKELNDLYVQAGVCVCGEECTRCDCKEKEVCNARKKTRGPNLDMPDDSSRYDL